MPDRNDLKQKLELIHNKDYVNYQSLLGIYDFPLFRLIIQHIPKDPFAPPHTGLYRIQVKRNDNLIVQLDSDLKIHKIAFTDFLARHFYTASERISKCGRGTGYSGLITINQPGQAILERNNVVITDEFIEVRCFLGMPGKGRIVNAEIASQMFFDELPEIVAASLLKENINQDALLKHLHTAEDAECLRKILDDNDLVAFIAEGAILPRESGLSDKPMVSINENMPIPFKSPENLHTEIKLPHAGIIKGMPVYKGVTLIVGGGYHGKSTLLNALETGIYNHIPGDGREYCVSHLQTTKIRAYSGRHVIKTDISGFINNLPFNQDTTLFSTQNASGSTSQAVNIVEAVEAGSTTLLMDEDTCAANFMIRDSKMQQLVNKGDEPITAYIDRVRQLYDEYGISTILVLGGVGDYFDVADQVIQMVNYQAMNVTDKAHSIAESSPASRKFEGEYDKFQVRQRIPVADSIVPVNRQGKYTISASEVYRLKFGSFIIDLTDVEQLIELSQTKAIGFAINYAKQYMDDKRTLYEVVQQVIKDIDEVGLDVLSDKLSGHYASFRALELAFAINRLAGFDVIQQH